MAFLGRLFFCVRERDGESILIGSHQFALVFLTVESNDFDRATDVASILTREFERRIGASGADIEFEVLFIAVKIRFDSTAKGDAVIDDDTVVAIDIHKDTVVGGYFEVDKVFVRVGGKGLFDNVENTEFIYHSTIKKGTGVPSF